MSVAADMPKQDVALRAAGNAASLFSNFDCHQTRGSRDT